MKEITKVLMMVVLLFAVYACGNNQIGEKLNNVVSQIEEEKHNPIDAKLEEAADYINDDYHERAKTICDGLLKNSFHIMTMEQKCDLAVLYCIIYDELGDTDSGKKFVYVFDETMKNPQKARSYYKSVYGEEIYEELKLYKEVGELDVEIDDW